MLIHKSYTFHYPLFHLDVFTGMVHISQTAACVVWCRVLSQTFTLEKGRSTCKCHPCMCVCSVNASQSASADRKHGWVSWNEHFPPGNGQLFSPHPAWGPSVSRPCVSVGRRIQYWGLWNGGMDRQTCIDYQSQTSVSLENQDQKLG